MRAEMSISFAAILQGDDRVSVRDAQRVQVFLEEMRRTSRLFPLCRRRNTHETEGWEILQQRIVFSVIFLFHMYACVYAIFKIIAYARVDDDICLVGKELYKIYIFLGTLVT